MKVSDYLLLVSMTMIVLSLSRANSVPVSDEDAYVDDGDRDRLSTWILDHLAGFRRDRRKVQLDAGFQSRHSALRNFLNSFDAGRQAADPHGPGRKK